MRFRVLRSVGEFSNFIAAGDFREQIIKEGGLAYTQISCPRHGWEPTTELGGCLACFETRCKAEEAKKQEDARADKANEFEDALRQGKTLLFTKRPYKAYRREGIYILDLGTCQAQFPTAKELIRSLGQLALSYWSIKSPQTERP